MMSRGPCSMLDRLSTPNALGLNSCGLPSCNTARPLPCLWSAFLSIYPSLLTLFFFFFFNDPAPPEFSPFPLHAALPICLELLDDVMYKSIAVGFAFFPIATVLGALWAAEAWGGYWSWAPKETWALIVWLNYAAWLHMRLVKGRSEEHTSELQSPCNLVCRLLLEKKK